VRVAVRLGAIALALMWSTGHSPGHAEDGARLGREWLGYFSGTVTFDAAFPPPVDFFTNGDDSRLPSGGPPIRVSLAIGDDEGGPSLWLSIAGGPMSTGPDGETLQFGHWTDATQASLDKATGAPPARRFVMKVENGKLRTEAEFKHADNSIWWRYVNLSPTPDGLNVLIWIFDGSGARSWTGLVRREN
jgi:hypothetical protein